jgi:hypothetical protein
VLRSGYSLKLFKRIQKFEKRKRKRKGEDNEEGEKKRAVLLSHTKMKFATVTIKSMAFTRQKGIATLSETRV